MTPIDDVVLNFDPTSRLILNVILGVVMFGVALNLTPADFMRLFRTPRALAIGFFSQFVFLPAATLLLVLVAGPVPSIALGLFLVAACPGGNISNFIVHWAGGNTALSVSLTASATLFAIVMTPFNIGFWSSFYEPAAALSREIAVAPLQMVGTVAMLLLLPLAAGMLVRAKAPALAARLQRPMQLASLAIFALFILGAFAANFGHFLDYIGVIFVIVLFHNAIAIAGGYGIAWLGRLDEPDRRAVSVETGIQNSGLGLVLILNFFDGLGGMAIVAAWWGVWHLIAGMALATWFRRRDAKPAFAV